jgi:NADP-dependent 3-hydroxy acid dehydrogenase YdfG
LKKVLIITGGSSGIGFATAKLFQENGFSIINLSRSSINLDKALHFEVDLSESRLERVARIKFQTNTSVIR